MKRIFLLFTFFTSVLYASDDCFKDQGFYLKIGTGACISCQTKVDAPFPPWDVAVEGYDANMGTRPIVLGGLGYDSPYITTEITAAYRPNFSYKKFQTPTTPDSAGQLGLKTRRFHLDVSTIMLNLFLNGRGFQCLNWKTGCYSSIFPFIGGGVGISQLKIFDFRSTGLPPIVTPPAPSFASENEYSIRYRFTYQVMGGFEFRYRDVCALSLGYRWFDVSRFKGPQYIRRANGDASDVRSGVWQIKFKANEAFLEFKVFL